MSAPNAISPGLTLPNLRIS